MLSEVVDQIREQGEEEGMERKARETALRMLAKGYAIEDAAEVSGLEIDEVRRLAENRNSEQE